LLHPEQRPQVWRPISTQLDAEKVGLTVEEVLELPDGATDSVIRRSYFDTHRFSKSHVGHNFPARLSEVEKAAVLEYLKTL
jgi:hypothetical protein